MDYNVEKGKEQTFESETQVYNNIEYVPNNVWNINGIDYPGNPISYTFTLENNTKLLPFTVFSSLIIVKPPLKCTYTANWCLRFRIITNEGGNVMLKGLF